MASSAEGTHRHPSKPPGETPGETAQRARPPEGALGPWRKDLLFRASLRRVPTPCAAPREAVTLERTPAPPVAAAPTLVSHHCRRPRHRPYTPAPPASSVTPPGHAGWVLGCGQAPPSLHLPFRVPQHPLNSLKMTALLSVSGLAPARNTLPSAAPQTDRSLAQAPHPHHAPHSEQPGPPQVCLWPSVWGRASCPSVDSLWPITPGIEQDVRGPYYDKATPYQGSGWSRTLVGRITLFHSELGAQVAYRAPWGAAPSG